MLQEQQVKLRLHTLVLGRIKDYSQLLKLNLSLMVVFSSVIGYLMAPGISFNLKETAILFLGGLFVTGSANAINEIIERDSDGLMSRTKLRPLPEQRMSISEAWIFAFFTGVAGVFTLSYFFNVQAGMLSLLSLLLYAFVYTPMKKVHPISVLIGAIPGALPPLIGWVAATGHFEIGGWVLFLLQFFWQFPHFWAIAWVAYEDYDKAGIRMLPTRERETRFTGLQCMFYSLVLIPMAVVPRIVGLTGNIGMWICMACGILYFVASVAFYKNNDRKSARRVMFSSFIYLPTVLLALWFDKM